MTHLIRQMGYVAFTVPDPSASAQDLVDVTGLKITDRVDGTVYLSSNQRHHEISYRPGERAAVEAIGLEAIDAAAVDEISRRLGSDGVTILDDRPLDRLMDRAVRFMTPVRRHLRSPFGGSAEPDAASRRRGFPAEAD